jgi:hypothetical protein
MKRIHGRKNQPLEYVEFRNDHKNASKNHPAIVAQRAGDIWNVFKVWPGKKGRIQTLHYGCQSLIEAEALAKKEAGALYC